MWGAMIKQMKEKKKDRLPEELLDTLDRIRVSFRNPTSHPDKIYDSDEAQDLFGLCVDALNRIVKSRCWKTAPDSIGELLASIERERGKT
jgi:phosphomevalonate kinase